MNYCDKSVVRGFRMITDRLTELSVGSPETLNERIKTDEPDFAALRNARHARKAAGKSLLRFFGRYG